jgi:hypothetical protein
MTDALRAGWLVLCLLAVPAQAQSWMVGSWFGTGQPGESGAMYIDHMQPDGVWRGEYRSCRAGKARDMVQTGHWRLDGDTLILKVETVGGLAAPRTDVYRMVSHAAQAQKYLSLPANFAYSPRRVGGDFTMPSCELVS